MRALRLLPMWTGVGTALIAVVLYFCLEPPGDGGIFLIPDKLSHLLAFFALTTWFAALVERRRYPLVAVLMLALGIGIEWLQDWMALGRSAETADVYADAVGIVLGLAFSLLSRDPWLQRVERWLSI